MCLRQLLLLIMIVVFIGAHLMPSSVIAKDTPITLKGVTLKELSRYQQPKLIDAKQLNRQLEQTLAGLEALIHMSHMVSEKHARRALGAQIDALKASILSLKKDLSRSPTIDYAVPPPPPTVPTHILPKTKTNALPPTPIGASRLSQHWSALESAPFREEKMSVIRRIAREEYLNVTQAEILIEGLTFSKDRQNAIILLYPKLVDPERVHDLYSLLDQPAHRSKVEAAVKRVNMKRRARRAQ